MKLKFVLFPIFVVLVALSIIENAAAQMPRSLTIQGVLTDSTSKPVPDGIHTITLRLYDKLFGGNIVHTEEFTTPVFKGLFNLTIGSQTPIPQSVVFDKQYYVGISCDGHSEIARIPFSSVPYSLMAESVPDGSITSSKIADGSITLEKLSHELRIERKVSTGLANNATGQFAFIGGGDNNVASGNYSSVIGGLSNKAQANFATAAGGNGNTAIALNSTVSGGNSNSASSTNATVGGGSSNSAAATYSTVAGGLQNMSSGNHSAISGGYSNISSGNFSSINGGQSNTASNVSASIAGGQSNIVSSQYGAVGGGYSNSIGSSSNGSVIAGGYDNTISANSQYSFIGGGYTNSLSSQYSSIGGGYSNSVTGNYGSVLGGKDNLASGIYSFVGGGLDNTASGAYSVVNGGNGNTASGNNSSVNGGANNIVSGESGAIVGGSNNIVSAQSGIAMGSNISVSNTATGAIVIGNGATSSAKLSSSTPNSLSIGFGSSIPTFFVEKAQGASGVGKIGIGNTSPTTLLDVSGAITLRSMSNPGVAGAGQGRIYFDPVSGKFRASENGSDFVDLIGEGGGGGGGWQLTGNAGIVEGTHYIGPTDDKYLELRAGEGCNCGGPSITRLRLNTNGSIQRFGDGDTRGDNAIDFQDIRDADDQVASGEFSVISGGVANTASEYGSAVGGGESNVAGGIYSTVSGGNRNIGTGFLTYIGGGQDNSTDGIFNSVVGGAGNIAEFDASLSSILGGGGNIIGGTEGGASFSTILGGDYNTVTSNYSVILGGTGLRLDGQRSLGFHANNFNTDVEFYDRDMTISDDNTVVLGNVDLWLANNNNSPRTLRFYEQYDAPGDFPSGTNFVGFKAPDAIDNDVVWALPNADGTSGQVLSTDGAGVLSWVTGSAGLIHFTESENVSTPNDVGVPVVQLIANSVATNVDVALTPKGTGALLAQIPDNTDVGGNKRGEQAVDWQMLRSFASQVASGAQSTIGGGLDNTASGLHSVVTGGYNNVSSNDNSTVGGGLSNTASQVYTTVAGGINNTANAQASSVSGGQGNNATGNSSVVGGGESNTSNASHATVGGGQNNSASNSGATIAGGLFNSAAGLASAIGGGWSNYTDSYSAIPGGVGLIVEERSFGFNANMDSSNFNVRPMNVSLPNTAVFNNVDFWLTNNDNTTRSLRFYEQYNDQGTFPNGTNFVGFKAPNAIASDVTWTLPDADGTSGQVLSTDGSGVLSWTTAGGGLVHFTESVNTIAPNDGGVPIVQLLATNAATDVDIALTPKGTGALTAHIADDNASGGAKRGQYAVDWQMERTDFNMVAAGNYSVISGGRANSARGFAGVVAGGSDNSVGFDVTNSAVLGGAGNAVGGIETAGNYSSIVGGRNNAVTGDLSVVLGGSGLNLSGARSFGFNANLDDNGSEVRDMAVSSNNTAIFANVDLWLASNDNIPRTLRFYEQHDAAGAFPGTTNYVGFKAPNTVTADVTWTLPNSDGEAGKVLTTDGSGNLSWTGGSIPCGGIIMWTGDINSVPAGWALCDGSNGTPNLNDRFPRGTTTASSVGTSGGNDSHSHTVDDHSHTITGISGSGSGTATFSGTTDNSTTGITANLGSGSDVTTSADGSNNTLSSTVDITDNGHTHGVSGSSSDVSVTVNVSGSTDNSSGVGTNQADNVPAFVYVGYIMRVCTP